MYYYEVCIISNKLDSFFTYQFDEKIDILSVVEVSFRNRDKNALVIKEVQKPQTYKCLDIKKITNYCLDENRYKLAHFMSRYYVCPLSLVLGVFVFDQKDATTLEVFNLNSQPTLSDKQNEAFDFCLNNKVSLLFGDTGSGKTEIYIKAIFQALLKNQSVILLIPEISLTPQMQNRLESYFNDSVAIWHSQITKKKKELILENIKNSKIKIIAGARSSLFLPMKNLGLIIVDEEHDDSYKSMNAPMYNARDIAIYYAKTLDIPIILGSATPSLNSYVKHPVFRLKESYHKANKNFHFTKNNLNENEYVLEQIKQNFLSSKQTIVFTPTKANFQYLICKNCSYVVKCPNCSISLSLYTKKYAQICHYCNHIQRINEVCPECRIGDMSSKNMGTSEVINIIQNYIPKANIAQFDKNKITTSNKLSKMLDSFNKNEIDIIVGTQMVVKGHDYHNVSLVVVLNIDSILNMQDYKSRERAVGLFKQIAGRTGRKGEGKVIIQSTNEQLFKEYIDDYESFLKDEMFFRKDFYPPYKKLARVLFENKKQQIAQGAMNELKQEIAHNDDIEVVGYGEAPISKIASKYRYYVLLRCDKITSIINSLHKCNNSYAQIDIDPVSFT